jgi:hypothetical protein
VRHRFERLTHIVDLQLAFQKLTTASPDWRPRTPLADLDSLLILGLAMARRLQPDLIVTRQFRGSVRQREHLEKLADRLWQQLLTQPSDPLDWRTAHAFFLEIELPGWPRTRRRFRHLRILAGRVLLRPLRLFSDLFRSRPS